MPCYSPMRAWRTGRINPETGKMQITFSRSNALVDIDALDIPCGKCIGCRIRYSTDWALRCVHESMCFEHNSFITLTYNDENLPPGATLVKKHFVDFMKRLRRRVEPTHIRYFMCGEYGDLNQRPHYHALIFNYSFPDKEEFKYRKNSILYTSKLLEELWPFGFSSVGALTYETASYVAQYSVKKITGDLADEVYGDNVRPYVAMSRKPGIGSLYFDKYKTELLRYDSIVHNGRQFPLPRFYTEKFTDEQIKEIKFKRISNIDLANSTISRLRVAETVKNSLLKYRNRNLDE